MAELYDLGDWQRSRAEAPEIKSGDGLKSGDGGGTFDGMEARVAKLEALSETISRDLGEMKTDIRELRRDARTDFRTLFGALIAVALGLAGLMAKGFHWF